DLDLDLDLCQRYLHIESLRLGERLHVQWQFETPPTEAETPNGTKNHIGCINMGINRMSCRFEYTFVALIGLIEGSVRIINGRLMTQTALDAGMDCHWFAARKAPLSETPSA
ncbi:MAG: hypothetical protein VX122_08870, partial [Pseudomonadota bacterium]|nr:hypothetical protein [Pseudomonadota bacterium]